MRISDWSSDVCSSDLFSKSVGTVGGFCVSNHPKFEIMRLVCRPYVFTASLPPSVVATPATSIRKLMHGANKRAHLWGNSKTLHKGLRDPGFTPGTAGPQAAVNAEGRESDAVGRGG